jgi:hypothetical protein
MSNISIRASPLQGWTDSPNTRGTIDIVSSCIFTIFICVWSVLCVNIRPSEESAIAELLQKLKLAFLCVLGPDCLLLLAVGQFESARKSCRQFESLNMSEWSLRHAFYADMGGFIVRTSDGVSWPLDANQLYYLIHQGWINKASFLSKILPKKSDIDDTNKQNTLVRLFSMAQILWFLVSCIARGYHRLPVTTIELTTIGFIATAVATTIAWYHKPADVKTQHIIELNASVSELHANAGLDNIYYWYDTPLDFLNPEKAYYGVIWDYCLNILFRIFMIRRSSQRPITRRPDDNFPAVSRIGMVVVVIPGIISWGANLMAWNLDFPTSLEKYMWRASSLTLIATVFIVILYHQIITCFFPKWKKKASDRFAANYRRTTDLEPTASKVKFSEKVRSSKERVVLWLSNNSFNSDPSWTIELRTLLPGLIFGALYTISKLYLLVEDLIGFRGQNPGVYKLVNWGGFLPHV